MSEERTTIQALEPVVALMAQEKRLSTLTDSAKILKEQIEGILPQYAAANYSAENIADAKADRALLNKLSKAVNENRIAFEKEFMKPLTEFKDVVSEVTALVKKASDAIDKVVKEVEEKEKAERTELINKLWRAQEFDTVPLSQVKKPEWMVKATSKKSIAADMAEIVNTIKNDLALLEQTVHPDDWNAVKLFYLTDLDYRKASLHVQKLKVQREEDAEKKRKAAEAAIKPSGFAISSPATGGIAVSGGEVKMVAASLPPASVTSSAPAAAKPYNPNEILTRTFRVTAPAHQIVRLGEFMKANFIPFEKIEAGGGK